jgi:hypothetical protein
MGWVTALLGVTDTKDNGGLRWGGDRGAGVGLTLMHGLRMLP